MNEYEMIEKILEPFSFADEKICFYDKYDKYGKQIECDGLMVAVRRMSMVIYVANYRHEVSFATFGCDNVDPELFCNAIRRAMQSKFGLSKFDYSEVECTDGYLKLYQFDIQHHKTIKYRNKYEKKCCDLDKEIDKVCKLIKEKRRTLDSVSGEYHNLLFAKNRLPFYALKQKKEYDKKISAVKPKYDSLISEICSLEEKIPRLLKERSYNMDMHSYSISRE